VRTGNHLYRSRKFLKHVLPWDSLSSALQGEAMTSVVVLAFTVTYVGMAFGRIPGLRVDRSGIAMVAGVILVATGALAFDQIVKAIHFTTLLLMGGLMIPAGLRCHLP
jgi:di/tricarboxylate transporter